MNVFPESMNLFPETFYTYGRMPSGLGGAVMHTPNLRGVGYDYATAPGGIGLDQYYLNIANALPNLTGQQLAAEMDAWGVTPEDVAEAINRYSGLLPQYNLTASDIAVSYAGGGGTNPEYLAAINTDEFISSSASYVQSLETIDAAAEAALAAQNQAEAAAAAAAAAAAVEASNAARAAEAERLQNYYAEIARLEAETRAIEEATAAAQAAAQAAAAAEAARLQQTQAAAAAAAQAERDKLLAQQQAALAQKSAAEREALSWFESSLFARATAQQKADAYNRYRTSGKTDAEIRQAADYFFGPQSNEDWQLLQQMARDIEMSAAMQQTTTQPAGNAGAIALAALAAALLLGA